MRVGSSAIVVCSVFFVTILVSVSAGSVLLVESGSSANALPSDSAPDDRIPPLEGPACPHPTDPEIPGSTPRIVELYTNPTTDGNVGEYLAIDFPEQTTLENWSITDGHTTASFPNKTVSDTVVFSMDPEETASMTDHRVYALEGYLRLAVVGDDLTVRRDGTVVDQVSTGRGPTAQLWHRTADARGTWWPRGATCRESVRADGGNVTAFVLPDSPEVPLEGIADAEDRISLGGYTFTSEAIADELEAALERGVDVEILLEAGPVGGAPDRTKPVLDDLVDSGATIRALGGAGARYNYHHAKYAVVDDRAIVTTENWKPSGIGGTSSRGWGVVADNQVVTDELEAVFRADFEGRDTTSWDTHREEATFVESDPPGGAFEGDIDSETLPVDSTDVLLAPDNAEGQLLEYIESATESILIKQVRIGGRDHSLLEATLEAAREGVEVRILLDATWYVENENRNLANWLERTADSEELPLEVRLVEPRNRFEKIHAKGVVIDEYTTVVGSINWNDNSLHNNREVALALHGDVVGSFYTNVFEDDWEEGAWPLPVSVIGGLVIALLVAGLVGHRYVSFGDERDGGVDPGSGVWPEGDIEPGRGVDPGSAPEPDHAGEPDSGDEPIGEGQSEALARVSDHDNDDTEEAETGTGPDEEQNRSAVETEPPDDDRSREHTADED